MTDWDERDEMVKEAVRRIRSECPVVPSVGIILGSGFGPFVAEVERGCTIPYSTIPHFKAPTVHGHQGFLVMGRFAETQVAILQGRVHLYEGHTPSEVTFPVRVLAGLGVRSLIVTNASGSFTREIGPGEVMLVRDHIDLTFRQPLRGECGWKRESLVKRCPVLYDRAYMDAAARAAAKHGVALKQGVLCSSTGPSYETGAESEFMRRIGAHSACMSTAHEVLIANTLGLRVLGLSCISNLATGVGSSELSHEEVAEVVGRTVTRLVPFFKELVKQIAAASAGK
jgi:purine-nucleoside phosphorylase